MAPHMKKARLQEPRVIKLDPAVAMTVIHSRQFSNDSQQHRLIITGMKVSDRDLDVEQLEKCLRDLTQKKGEVTMHDVVDVGLDEIMTNKVDHAIHFAIQVALLEVIYGDEEACESEETKLRFDYTVEKVMSDHTMIFYMV